MLDGYAVSDSILADLGSWTLPGMTYRLIASAAVTETENWHEAPFWFVSDSPYVCESAAVSFAEGLALGWQRTWADLERTAENGADSFAAITAYLLACDDSGAVQTGLTVNGQAALCVSYPYAEFYGDAVTQLMWYDPDEALLFSLTDFPDGDAAPRTAEQLISLAESVVLQ